MTRRHIGRTQLQTQRFRIWLSIFSVIGAVGVLLGMQIYAEYERERAMLEARLMTQAKVVDENLKANLASVSLILETLAHLLQASSVDKGGIQHFLEAQQRLVPGIDTILVTDAQGKCLYASHEPLIGRDFGTQGYFRSAQAAPDPRRRFMSAPYRTASGSFLITIARALVDARDSFEGIVSVSLQPAYFQTLLQSTVYAPDNYIALIHSDGIVFSSIPNGNESIVGWNLAKLGKTFPLHMASRQSASIQRGVGLTTGDVRIFAYVTIADADQLYDNHLVVATSRNWAQVLTHWRRQAWIQLVLYLIISGIGVGITVAMRARGRELHRLSEYNWALLDSVRARIAILNRHGEIISVNKSWRGLVEEHRQRDGKTAALLDGGGSYLQACLVEAGPFAEASQAAHDGILAVLEGRAPTYSLEYACHAIEEKRWFYMTVEPLLMASGGAVVTHTDITQRKLLEEELRRSEAQNRLLTDSIRDVVWTMDIQTGRFTYVSPSVERLRGYTAEEVMALPVSESLTPASRENVQRWMKENIQAAARGSQDWHYRLREVEQPCKDGSTVWTEVASEYLLDASNVPVAVIGVSRDITERRKLEAAVRAKSEELDRFFSMALDLLVIADVQGYFRRVNPTWETTLGYPVRELEGARFLDLVHPDDLASTLSALGDLSSGQSVLNFANRYRCQDGSFRWIEWRAFPYSNELIYAAARDITERIQVEERLRANERFMRTLTDNLPGMVAYWNLEQRCEFANRAYREWFEKTPEELHEIRLQALLGPDLFKLSWPRIQAALRGEAQSFERTLVRGNGESRDCWVHYIPDVSGDAVRGFVVLVSDVSELKRAEKSMLEAKEAAEASNRIKSEFLANMSHELRTPMNAITGMTYLVLQTELEPKQRDYLIKIQRASESLLGIVNDLLDFSKIEAGKLELEVVPFKLDEVFEHLRTLAAKRAKDKGLQVELRRAQDIPAVLIGDPLRLGQVLGNLVDNAVKFTHQGRIVIGAALACPPEDGQLSVTFSVVDSGIGMSPAQLERAFKPFSQADSSITRTYGGTGLGLSIVERLVRLMGGCLEVESQLGQGSRFAFTIRLKASREEQRRGSAASLRQGHRPPKALLRIAGARILVVEDNPINQQVVLELLQQAGMSVRIVEGGPQALQSLERGDTYDLIFMDIQMPLMDGYEATRRIRALLPDLELPIVAMTAHTMAGAREKCLEAGMNDHLPKPISPASLHAMLLAWIPPRLETPVGLEEPILGESPGQPSALPEALPGLDVADGLGRVGGNEALYRRILLGFCSEHPARLKTIRRAIQEGGLSEARSLVHSSKGLAGTVGALALHAAFVQLEEKLDANATSEALSLLEQTEGQMRDLCNVLAEASLCSCRAGREEPTSSQAEQELASLFPALMRALENNDLQAVQVMRQLCALLPPSPALEEVQQCVEDLRFAWAQEKLRTLAAQHGFELSDG